MILPKLELPLLLIFSVFGIAVGMFFDHTISLDPFNFYDVNDRSSYQIIDFISYVMFAPFAYFFVYLYKKLNIKGYGNIVYIVLWSFFSVGFELLANRLGVYHYKHGYRLLFSFPIYVCIQSSLVIFYHLVMKDFKDICNRKS